MHKSKHYHKCEAAFDLSWLLYQEGMDRGSTFKTAFPEIVESYLKNDDGGYTIPLGFILYDYDERLLSLDRSETIETALPNELFKQLQLVVSLFNELGFDIVISDIIRFMIWTQKPNSIAPNGDNLVGLATISLPTLVWLSNVYEDDIQMYERKSRSSIYPTGMSRYHRTASITQLDGFVRRVESIFTNGNWHPSFHTRLVSVEEGFQIPILCVEVVERVDNVEPSNDTSGPNSLNSKEVNNNEVNKSRA